MRLPPLHHQRREGLVLKLAEEMWISRMDRGIDPPWERAGHWQGVLRDFAETTLKMLERDHS